MNLLDLSLRKVIRKIACIIFKKDEPVLAAKSVQALMSPETYRRISSMKPKTSAMAEIAGCGIYFTDNEALFGMLDEIYVNQSYRFETENPRPVILDCGANIGLGVLYLKRLYPNAIVHAFEPDKQVYDALRQNVESNGLTDVHMYNSAVWTEDTTLAFESDGSWGGYLSESADGKVSVQAEDLNRYLDSKIDLLKVDIEGAETTVLLHAKDRIARNVERLVFEWHSVLGEGQRLGEILMELEKSGFRYHIKEAAIRPRPFTYTPPGRMDSQLDVYAWR